MSNRREFISQSFSAGGAMLLAGGRLMAHDQLPKSLRPLRILILGATGYIGPYHVHAALARGHQVSVFTRGKSVEKLPSGVEQLVGDRNGDLGSVKDRDWDAVLDLATYVPAWVRTLGEALKGRVRHYTLISTVAAYQHPKPGRSLREDSALAVYKGNQDPFTLTALVASEYGSLKALCEREAEKQFPNRSAILRPGYIAGPDDPYNRVMQYWLARLAKGGEVLVSGHPSIRIQYLDVRDMAEWVIRLAENAVTGIYNTVGPAVPETLGQFLEAARSQAGASASLTWVNPEWLAGQGDKATWYRQLFWSYEPDAGWMMRMDNSRALGHGFAMRPLSTTLGAIMESMRSSPATVAELVKPLTWDAYLAREKATISAWHAN